MAVPVSERELRLLMRPATARDAAMAATVLGRAGIASLACADMAELVAALDEGAGALLIAEETLTPAALAALHASLTEQPPWSDLAVLVLARQGADSALVEQLMDRLRNITILERPVRLSALVSAVRSALVARRRQYELRGMLDDLRTSDRRKTEFLATLAHELRNPLAPISTALTVLAQGRLPPAQQPEFYALMRRQVDHMTRLVDDLMEVSRITRGKIELKLATISLAAVLHDAVGLSRPLIDAAGHTLAVDITAEPLWVRGDAVRLAQVYSNLLNNAAKYTPAGGRIAVVLRREGDRAAVVVSDTGAGLDPQMLEPIFDMFVQAANGTRTSGGLGIGLTLVRSIVELHGGSVTAASPGSGRGATFTVRLPLAQRAARDDAAAPAEPPAAMPKTVLVVDDNRDAADTLAELLRELGATALVAYDAEQALRLAAGHRLNGAVLDIGLPGTDGCALARQLRAASPHDGLTLVALTGFGQPADRRRIADAGFDHHLLKPASADELVRALSSRRAASTAPAQPLKET